MTQTTKTTPVKRFFTQTIWGQMAEFSLSYRIGALVLVMAAILSMSFCQLGCWSAFSVDGRPVYFILLLAPLAMGALLFGPYMGALLGLYAGAIVFAHAQVFPLDYFEVYFMTPVNTFCLMPIWGAFAGALYSFILKHGKTRQQRIAGTVAAGIVLSFAASGLMMLNTIVYYGGMDNLDVIRKWVISSPLGVVIQALVDAALLVLMCLVAGVAQNRLHKRPSERALLALFRNWLFLVAAITFMVASSIIFSLATVQAQELAFKSMGDEADYVVRQLELNADQNVNQVLDGYAADTDGLVVITDKQAIVLSTDSEDESLIGKSYVDILGYGDDDNVGVAEEADRGDQDSGSAGDDFKLAVDDMVLQAVDANGMKTLDFTFVSIREYDKGYVAVQRTPAMIYESRFDTMVFLTVFAIALIASIAVLASVLMSQVVVRRVDETNESLHKITDGNLNERVRVADTREFSSLSTGINTTVSALKDTIAEVEQRNAQDLATAKTIQESALPREFPPFPHIGQFDLYASMKTAKEVGGDFYDFFLIGEDKLGFIVADVSGKGIPAALFMMTAKTQMKNFMEAGLAVNEAVGSANHQLCLGNDAGMFVTVWVGVLDYNTGLLTYVNGGHNPPLILHDGTWEWMKDVSGLPLGLFDGVPYDVYTRQLQPKDTLYLYTDGVTEAMDTQGKLFGEDKLVAVLNEFGGMNARSIGVGVRRALTDYTKDADQSDDITMLILKHGVPPEKKAVMVLPADDKQLPHVYNFIHEELHRRSAPQSTRAPLDIAAEELFVNVCHYAYPEATPENPGEVRISFEYAPSPPSLTVEIADDGIPYDPLAKPDAVTPDDVREVPIGGLGILMAKRSFDEMSYRREGGSNIVTFKKAW